MPRLRFAIRSLAKAPLLSLVVVLSLGLGIGLATGVPAALALAAVAAGYLPARRASRVNPLDALRYE